jgi:iron complex outermembrane receptor protein
MLRHRCAVQCRWPEGVHDDPGRQPRALSPIAWAIGAAIWPALASGQLEEVVVTAQKRLQSTQDVGIAITALSSDQLETLGIENTTQIAQQVPALQLFTFSPAFTVFSLRGISQTNFQDNLEAPVAVYMDDAYVASMNAINTQLFDVDRVEVLRGPQGTLFGRNATGGLIHFITRKADAEELDGYVEAGAADFGTYSFEGAFGGAFSDRVRGRIAGRWEKSEGYVEAGTALGRTAIGRDSNGANGFALRGSLQIEASEQVLVDLSASYARDEDVPTGEYIVSLAGFDETTGLGAFTDALDPADPGAGPTSFDRTPITGSGWRHWSDENPYMDRTMRSATAQVRAQLGNGSELVSITNALSLEKFYIEDAGGGFGFFPYNTVAAYDQWSQELRLSGERDRLRWQIGAYYLDMKWDTFQSVTGALILGGTSDTQQLATTGIIDSSNWSAFGQAEFDLAPQWTLIAGLRWSQDDKSLRMNRVFEDVPEGVPPTETFNIDDVAIPGIASIDYGDYAARLQLNWKLSTDSLFYAAFNRGIKGGNWSLDTLGAVAPENLEHGPEKLKAWELGFKSDFLQGRARLNAAAFYYDYRDYQAFSLVGLTPQVANSDAEAQGGEIELMLSPARGLNLSLGVALMDSEVDAVPDVFGGTVRAEFPTAPQASINFLGRYEWPALAGVLALQVDGRWNDDQFLEGTNSEVSFEPAYTVWNASFGYRTDDERMRLALYLRNAGDEQYRLYNLDLGLLGFIQQVYAPPRQLGITAAYHW